MVHQLMWLSFEYRTAVFRWIRCSVFRWLLYSNLICLWLKQTSYLFKQGAVRLKRVKVVALLLEYGAEISPENKAEFSVQHPRAVLVPRNDKCLTRDLPLLSRFLVENSKKSRVVSGSRKLLAELDLSRMILNKLLGILSRACHILLLCISTLWCLKIFRTFCGYYLIKYLGRH